MADTESPDTRVELVHDGDHQRATIKRLAGNLLEQAERNTRKAEVDGKVEYSDNSTVYYVYERNQQSGWQSASVIAGPGAGEVVATARPERSIRTALYWQLALWYGRQPRTSWEEARSKGARCTLVESSR